MRRSRNSWLAILARPLCLFGLHQRSRGQAHMEAGEIVSVCRRCRRPMRKHGGRWMVVETTGPA